MIENKNKTKQDTLKKSFNARNSSLPWEEDISKDTVKWVQTMNSYTKWVKFGSKLNPLSSQTSSTYQSSTWVSPLFLVCVDAQTWDSFSLENATETMLFLYMNYFVWELQFSNVCSRFFYFKRNTIPEQCKVTSLLCPTSFTGSSSMSFLNIQKKCLHIQEFPE